MISFISQIAINLHEFKLNLASCLIFISDGVDADAYISHLAGLVHLPHLV